MKNPEASWIPLDATVIRLVQADAERHPSWPDMQNRWGLVLLCEGRAAEAAAVFSRCLEINPRYTWAALNRIQALALAGDFSAAHLALDRLERPAPAAVTFITAFVHLLEGSPYAAQTHLAAEGEAAARRHDMGRLRAAIERKTSPAAGERTWAEIAPEICGVDPDLAAPWDKAGSATLRYLSFIPGLHQLWYEASTLLGRLGRVEEAERAAAVAHLVWAERGLYLNQRGFLASLRGDDDEALDFYVEAARVAPGDPRPHIALAFHWSARGDLDRANQSLASALKRAPHYADLHYQMGLLLRARERTPEALESFRRALSINPGYTTARLEEAGALFRLQNWTGARAAFAQVLETGLASSDIHLRLGQIEEQLGRPDRAHTAYLEAIRLNPNEAEAHYLAGNLHRERGNREEAKKAWKTYLTLSRDPKRSAEVEAMLESD